MEATRAEAPDFQKGNSQLLMDYREAVLEAYNLGNDIKDIYGIIPPKVINGSINIGLVVN